nr:MAG TPA: hypothetical protein [Bacteriophage sp.]
MEKLWNQYLGIVHFLLIIKFKMDFRNFQI